jgi:hypothetical protein
VGYVDMNSTGSGGAVARRGRAGILSLEETRAFVRESGPDLPPISYPIRHND